ncbi:ankyrin repeat domain-containing protein [Fusarium phyllophilum]|uniref:Ankyrin repeat domain-containing protein n=1 Tax=Fusarium phyllophilum TaxID=47803 RepID=A0A8H5IGP9_9HYPO|nr:ankyrin repeat domain-containing protein [Fusarium phyllophilum]
MRALVERFESGFLERYDSLQTPVERSDVFRILVCKHFGEIYGDLDTELIRHPAAWISRSDLATWTDPKTGKAYGYYNTSGLEADNDPESDAYWRQSYTYPQQLSQWAFAAAPQHPVFERYMDNLRHYTRDNETAAQNSDPLKRTGPAAVTLATKSWLEDLVGFRWTSLTGVKDGGKSKLVEDILILPITGFHPSHGSRNDVMGRKPKTDPAARLCHHGTGLWKLFNFVGETEMAEVLGIASGAAGLLSLAIEVTKFSYTCIASVREHLRAKLEKKVSYGRIKARVAALAWPLSESELLDKVNMLHRYNGIFSSALQADSLTVAIATNKELQDIRQRTKAKEIIAWYKSDVATEASTSHLDDYCPSTWQTFLSGSFYQSWRSGSTPVVWGYGQPGAGKTVLSALVLRDVESGNLPGTVIASHFFSSSRPKEAVSNVLRSLIAQALRGCPIIPQEASTLYETGPQNLMMADLINVLGAIAKLMTTCIILDGLDECPFLHKFLNILSTLQDLGVRIFATAFKGHADIIETLWRYDKAPFRCDVKGLTPLHWAVSAGQTDIVKRLLALKTRFAQYEKSPVLSLPSLDDLTVERARAMTTRANESPFKFYSEGTDIEMFSAIFSALKQSFREKEDNPRERGEGYYTFDPFLYGPFGQSLKADHGRRARPDRDYQRGKPDVRFLQFVDQLLIHATRSQDLPIIKLVFDLKLVKASGIDSLALLHEAAASGWVEGMAVLIDLGADVNHAERIYRQTPLHRACQNQREEAVKLLLSIDKIDINAEAEGGRKPIMNLMTASYEEKGVNLYKLLVSRGASISMQDTEGNSLMHYALRTCNATVVQMLCTAGSSIESPNKSGQLPLHWMAHWKYLDLRKPVTSDEAQAANAFIIGFGKSQLGHCSRAVETHQAACEYGFLARVSERLASVSTRASRDRTMLYYELQPLPLDDWTRVLQLILDAGADINKVDWEGTTPLQLCVQRAASVPVIDTLLKLGASPYQAGKDGLDCFQLALMSCDEAGSWDIIRCLRTYANTHPDPRHYFCHGGFLIAADTPRDNEETYYLQVLRQTNAINCETRSGRTLIYEAASRGNTHLVRRLLEHDAYAHYIDDFGSSALHAAAKKQAPTTVAVLLQAGADVHQASMNEHGSTVTGTLLNVCLEACNGGKIKSETVETVRILLSYGADPNYAVVRDGRTETSLSLSLKALCQSIYYPNLDAIPSEDSDHLLLEVLKLLVDSGARVAESADDIIVGVVAKMEHYESLWEEMRSQLTTSRSHAPSLGAER